MGKRILTVGEPMGLLIAQEEGGLDEVKHFTSAIAGAEFNVAVGLTRLGHTVGYLTRVGRDPFGRQICRYMKQIGLDTGLTRVDQGRRTGFMLQSRTSQGDPDIYYFRTGSAASALSPADVTGLDLREWDAVHLTGILPAISPTALAASYMLADKARKAGVPVFFDPNLRPQLWPCRDSMVAEVNALAALADYVMPGVGEGEILCGSKDPGEIGRFYMERGARAVIVKTGANGAETFTRAGSFRTLAYRVEKIVDTVGAGDGFAVGVESALMEGLSLEQAVERGSAIGAIQITYASDNEGLPTRDELEQFMAQTSRFDKTGETNR